MRSFSDELPNVSKETIDETLKESVLTREGVEHVMSKIDAFEKSHNNLKKMLAILLTVTAVNLGIGVIVLSQLL